MNNTRGSTPIILVSESEEDLKNRLDESIELVEKIKSDYEGIFDKNLENEARELLDKCIEIDKYTKSILEKEKEEMENKNIMTEEQVNEVTKVLEENISEDVKHLREINDAPFPHNTINKPELIEADALIEINPVTGEQTVIGPASSKPQNDVTISDIVDGTDEDILNDVTIKEETYSKLNEFGLTNEETEQFTSVILRRLQGEKFSIYKELPMKIKNIVRSMCGSNNINQLQACSEIVVDQFISELKIEQEFVDFQDSLNKEIKGLDMMNMYDEYQNETMEKLLQKANELKDSEPEKAEKLTAIYNAYKDSFEFETMKKALEENWKEARRLDKEIKKYDRYCTEFNYKYKNSKFKINDITLVAHSLDRAMKNHDVSISDIKKFVVLFCRITRNMRPDDVVEHSYMYYTIKNILALDYMKIDSEAFIKTTENILEVIKLIDTKKREELERHPM